MKPLIMEDVLSRAHEYTDRECHPTPTATTTATTIATPGQTAPADRKGKKATTAAARVATTARKPTSDTSTTKKKKKKKSLCFDGTGNKFQGSAGDSNILKIYSMLDKEDPHLFRYYQPGIGTYVESSSMSKKSRVGRIKSWYTKAKDQAVGTSFGEHVMAGYKFLMRYYTAGDDIYFFG
jgi:uncharacterized protein (DUF2235 family)